MKAEPKPWSWEEYEDYLLTEWPSVLDSSGDSEPALHRFLELHPCLLPGGEASSTSIGGHHGPLPGAVITQPPLKGTFTRVPDFLWPTKVSGAFRPVLVELERADKKWLLKDGRQQTAELSQAIGQIAEWRTWFNSEENKLQFYKMFGISDWIRSYHKVEPVYSLIYGRRAEFANDPVRTQNRESIRQGWLQWSTYDRLTPDAGARNWVTVKIVSEQWTVISIPPTFSFDPDPEWYLQGLTGLDTAIAANNLIPECRKQLLLDQLSAIAIKPAADPKLWLAEFKDVQ